MKHQVVVKKVEDWAVVEEEVVAEVCVVAQTVAAQPEAVVLTAVAEASEEVRVVAVMVVVELEGVGGRDGVDTKEGAARAVRAMAAREMVAAKVEAVATEVPGGEASTSSERRKKCTARSVPRRQPPH